MKKILILTIVLALAAIMLMPLAASADTASIYATGAIGAPSVALTAPATPYPAFGTFAEGWNGLNGAVYSGVGTVTLTPGSDASASWTLTATSTNDANGNFSAGQMWDGSRYLDNAMAVSLDGSNYAYLPGGATTGSTATGNFRLYTEQYITHNDVVAGAGNYYIYVVLTATVNV